MTDEATTDEPVVTLLDLAWRSIADLIAEFDESAWKTPTALPGWSVQDCVAHIIGTELSLMGEPAPDVPLDHLSHVSSDFQRFIEVWVEARRHLPGTEIAAEYHEVIARRLAMLRSMTPEAFEKPGWSPIGEVPYREFMQVRVFDSWMHEQDMRRALDRPGHLTGPVVDASIDRFRAAIGYLVGKKAAAPDGSSVVLRTTGENEVVLPVVVQGRARLTETAPSSPTVTITLPFTTLIALGGGRWDLTQAMAAGGVEMTGDADLGQVVLSNLAFTP
ncbi:MAG: maleylpyruvate isomerase family mycothiol-dependent enzyme [Acidimicrobiales bacterium]|nr:maleylpyruvate isomerase family mycothiol-dependent enzyme [Acidimicrobiales bacterium]